MRFLVALLVLMLGACASKPNLIPTEALDHQQWQARTQQLLAQESWEAHFSLVGNKDQQKFKTRVIWQQINQDQYEIRLKDFIGRTVAIIEGSSEQVVVKTSKGKRYEGSNADEIIRDTVGLRIPVEGMRYWLRAIPEPSQAYEIMSVNNKGLVASAKQSGWKLEYPNYQSHELVQLPTNAVLQFNDIVLTIKVSRWEFPQS